MKKEIIVLTSGWFDPLHVGHIELFKRAKALGDKLVVIVNSDESAVEKKGYVFMNQWERMDIIKAIKYVDAVYPVIDYDQTVADTLKVIKPDIFAKGGDRTKENLPQKELDVCKKFGIKIITGLGKKIQSSSDLVEKCKKNVQNVVEK